MKQFRIILYILLIFIIIFNTFAMSFEVGIKARDAMTAGNFMRNIDIFEPYANMTISANHYQKRKLLAIMYHSIFPTGCNNYVLHPKTLEEDFVWLKNNNYVPVTISDIISFCEGRNDCFPEKPVLITFDDGFYNNYTKAFPILKKYNYHALIAVVGSFTDKEKGEAQNGNYSNLNRKQLSELYQSGFIEYANHTYDMHNIKNGRKGAKIKENESIESYRKVLTEDLTKTQLLLKECTGKSTQCFSYPYGYYSAKSEGVLKEMGFKVALTCDQKMSELYVGANLMRIGRYNRPSGITSETFFERIIKNNRD